MNWLAQIICTNVIPNKESFLLIRCSGHMTFPTTVYRRLNINSSMLIFVSARYRRLYYTLAIIFNHHGSFFIFSWMFLIKVLYWSLALSFVIRTARPTSLSCLMFYGRSISLYWNSSLLSLFIGNPICYRLNPGLVSNLITNNLSVQSISVHALFQQGIGLIY